MQLVWEEAQIIAVRENKEFVSKDDFLTWGPEPDSLLDSKGIENVKNFDVEKWYNFNFLFCRKL